MSDNNGDCGAMGTQSRCCSPRLLITPRAGAEPYRTETMRESGHLRRKNLERISNIDLASLGNNGVADGRMEKS